MRIGRAFRRIGRGIRRIARGVGRVVKGVGQVVGGAIGGLAKTGLGLLGGAFKAGGKLFGKLGKFAGNFFKKFGGPLMMASPFGLGMFGAMALLGGKQNLAQTCKQCCNGCGGVQQMPPVCHQNVAQTTAWSQAQMMFHQTTITQQYLQ